MHSVNYDVETGSTKNVKSVKVCFAFILNTCLKINMVQKYRKVCRKRFNSTIYNNSVCGRNSIRLIGDFSSSVQMLKVLNYKF